MKTTSFLKSLPLFLALFALQAMDADDGRRQRPSNPRGTHDPRGAADPRGARDPRGAYDPRGVHDPRGARDPRGAYDPRGARDPRGAYDPRGRYDPRSRYIYSFPGSYARRVFRGATFYYYSGIYYYPYYINGRAVYVRATVVSGVPAVPPRPY